ncbi:hypothetical protein LINGRAPRIM_LOCUS1616 [Linum grandiflorum]
MTELVELLPAIAEQDPSEGRPKVEYLEASKPQEHPTLDSSHLVDHVFIKLIPKAHQNQQAEHGVVEVILEAKNVVIILFLSKAAEEDVEDRGARSGEGPDAGRMEKLGGEVAAEEPPGEAVGGGADVMLVGRNDLGDRGSRGSIGKDGTVLDESLVGKGVGCYEDGWAREDPDGENGVVFVKETAEAGFQV